MLHGFIHVGGVDVEPDNVGKTRIGSVQDGIRIVEGKGNLVFPEFFRASETVCSKTIPFIFLSHINPVILPDSIQAGSGDVPEGFRNGTTRLLGPTASAG